MLRTLEQIVSGKYEYEVKKPILSTTKIQGVTTKNVDYRGSLTVKTPEKQRLRVFATVTNARIVLEQERYSGTEIIINYGIDVRGLYEGDAVTGDMVFSTNCGECVVPVRINVEASHKKSSVGEIKNLDDLAKLARYDYGEACRFFAGSGMKNILANEQENIKNLYTALAANPITYQRLEEFLACAGKKETLHFKANTRSAEFPGINDSVPGLLTIQKNTWGNVNLNVTVDGDFIEVPQKHFVEDDFVGNVLDLQYVIRYDMLRDCIQKGKISISSDTDSFELHITASRNDLTFSHEKLKYKKNILGLEKSFVDFYVGNIDKNELVRRGFSYIDELKTPDRDSVKLTLLEAYLFLISNDKLYARQILSELDDHDFAEESALLEAGYIYLCFKSGHTDFSRGEVADELTALFEEDDNNLIILHMLIDVDEGMHNRPRRLLAILGRIFANGIRSPFAFIEAAKVLRNDPELLDNLSEFTKFVLLNMARFDLLTDELALKAAVLSANEKTFTGSMYRILTGVYRKFKTDEVLEAICRLIIKGNPRNKDYFKWFAIAVTKDIRITRIYEYYMETLPEGYRQILPFKVRRYFTLNNTLGRTDKAKLYANIIANRKMDEDTFEDYRDRMANFAFESLQRGYISDDFALIYSVFVSQVPTTKLAEAVLGVMFTHVLFCDDKRFKEVIVRHPLLKDEKAYPIKAGKAYIEMFSSDAVIVFRDERGRRFANEVHYSINRLIEYSDYLRPCIKLGVENPGLYLHMCVNPEGGIEPITKDNADMMLYLSTHDEVDKVKREEICEALLEYFAKHSDDPRGESFILSGNIKTAAKGNPELFSEMLIMYGHYEEAFEIVCRYGYERIDMEKLMHLTGTMIEKRGFAYDEELMLLAMYVFNHERYDENILSYLIKYYKGLVETMAEIRTRAAGFMMDTFILDERILKCSMFAHRHLSLGAGIFASYKKEGGKPIITEAYTIFEAMYCFLRDEKFDPYMEKCIVERLSKKDPPLILKLELLKVYAERKELSERELKTAKKLLSDCIKCGIVFSFYKKFPGELLERFQLDDKLIIECKAMPSDKVIIHYRYPTMAKDEYHVAPMKMTYGGIFARAFVMFDGEVLKYYFTVSRGDETIDSEVMTRVMTLEDPSGRSIYRRINQMIVAQRKGDREAFDELYKKYRLAVHVTNELFEIKKENE